MNRIEKLLINNDRVYTPIPNERSSDIKPSGYYFETDLSDQEKMVVTESIRKTLEDTKRTTFDDSNFTAWMEAIKSLPYRLVANEERDIKKIKEVLDKRVYGMEETKQKIIENIALKNYFNRLDNDHLIPFDRTKSLNMNLYNGDFLEVNQTKNKSQILSLVGDPGVGKTAIASAIAEALNRPLFIISIAGLFDSYVLTGMSSMYSNATYGAINNTLIKSGVSNPIILIDEIDKATDIKNNDSVDAALLQILDPEQNREFRDNFITIGINLSQVTFITTANYPERISRPLRDRMQLIEIPPYSTNEKIEIAQKHLIPKIRSEYLLSEEEFSFNESLLTYLIDNYAIDSGVRAIKRGLQKIASKISLETSINRSENFKVNIDEKLIDLYLSNQEQERKLIIKNNFPGSFYMLATNGEHGVVTEGEVKIINGKDETIITSNTAEHLRDSISIATDYVRIKRDELLIPKDYNFQKLDIHFNFLNGTIKKDGPSAGIAFVSAILSYIHNIKIPSNVSMSGEISLRGSVLKVGGIQGVRKNIRLLVKLGVFL